MAEKGFGRGGKIDNTECQVWAKCAKLSFFTVYIFLI